MIRIKWPCGIVALTLAARLSEAAPADYFGIHIVDETSGRGIPMVELRTTFKATYYTDSAGYVAFLEPGLAGQEVWFDIASPGYASPEGPFRSHGKAWRIKPGAVVELKLRRVNIAERLYRLTGYGRYRDSLLLGLPVPVKDPAINGLVTGQDTVQTAVFGGRMYWMWQDTDRLAFVLGNFRMTGATSALPGELDPDKGIDFEYFTEEPGEFVRPFTRVEREGNNPIWCDGLMVLRDAAGQEQMLGRYCAVDAKMAPVEAGLVRLNPGKQVLERLRRFENPRDLSLTPSGHPFRVRDGGKEYVYFSNPYPNARVEASFEAASDPSRYEGYSCARVGERWVWAWRRGVRPTRVEEAEGLMKRGQMQQEEMPFEVRDADTGKPVRIAGGSVAWSPYLKRWTFLFGQAGGDSVLGEIWFATAAAPEGPWREARKVATHAGKQGASFYNPMQHPELAREGGRLIYFEGTLATTFSGNPLQTPYYDYNQLMYRLDLADQRINLTAASPGHPPGPIK